MLIKRPQGLIYKERLKKKFKNETDLFAGKEHDKINMM